METRKLSMTEMESLTGGDGCGWWILGGAILGGLFFGWGGVIVGGIASGIGCADTVNVG